MINRPDWLHKLKPYLKSSTPRAIFQLLNTVVPYVGLMALMVWMLNSDISWWWILPICLPAAGLLVRIFIIFHDCTHNSFFSSKRANEIVGHITGTMVFTGFSDWQHTHAVHHKNVGDLDKRGTGGDIWTMTVTEYKASSFLTKVWYRIYRNPLFLFLIVPSVLFLVIQRFPDTTMGTRKIGSLMLTNAVIAGVLILSWFTIGLGTYLAVQVPVMAIAGTMGIWLFYVQHQYENVYWSRSQGWNPFEAALEGSSFYKLPAVLRWFTGNIGYHHIHHMNPAIPNYYLKKCYESIDELRKVEPLTISRSLKSLFLHLYDEQSKRMVTFWQARKLAGSV